MINIVKINGQQYYPLLNENWGWDSGYGTKEGKE